MADEVDKTNDNVMLVTDALVMAARKATPVIEATGFCLDDCCGEELPPGRRWCNADCRTAWEKDMRRQKLAGYNSFD